MTESKGFAKYFNACFVWYVYIFTPTALCIARGQALPCPTECTKDRLHGYVFTQNRKIKHHNVLQSELSTTTPSPHDMDTHPDTHAFKQPLKERSSVLNRSRHPYGSFNHPLLTHAVSFHTKQKMGIVCVSWTTLPGSCIINISKIKSGAIPPKESETTTNFING